MDECDPGAPLTDQASSDRDPDYTHADFAYKLKVQILPNDQENRGEFDVGVDFRIGDPNVHFRAAAAKSYETTEDVGKPDWNLLFGYILARMSPLRFLSTVYVLVDNRDLTNLDNLFQAQRIVDGKCRPVILHGYGGAKKEMPDSLAALAKFGWIPMAAAMVGSASSAPLWTGQDWRPILGTSVDTRILPPHLSYSCSVSGSASHVMTSTSGTPLTVGCLLTKSKLLLVLIVIYHRIQLERYLWTSAYPILICSSDPRNLPEANLNKLPSKKSRIHFLLRKRCW